MRVNGDARRRAVRPAANTMQTLVSSCLAWALDCAIIGSGALLLWLLGRLLHGGIQ